MLHPDALPLLTADLPGCAGTPCVPEDFCVEEIPAYLPCGDGEHCMALIQKRNLTTPAAIARICRELGLSPASVGYAGLKDKHAVTRQWISVPGSEATQQALLALQHDDLKVLQAARHRNKLRTGHLRGNRFTIVLRGVVSDAGQRALPILQRLERDGLPNYYGPQRFGMAGDNAQQALLIFRGEQKLPRDRQQRRLIVSALQSQLFNELLARRVELKQLRLLLGGEVLQRTSGSAPFISEDSSVDQPRLESGEVVITGPMVGPRMPRPKDGSAARMQEDDVLAGHGIDPEAMGRFGRLARGGRRPLTVPVGEPKVESLELEDGPALRLHFALPAGSYATVLLREVTKGSYKNKSG